MAVLSTTNPTLADVAKRYDADGKIDTIVELLAETNEVLDDSAAEEKLKTIRQQIIDEGNFGAVAAAVSEDVGSAQDGGDMGWAPRGFFVPEFEDVAYSLEKNYPRTSSIIEKLLMPKIHAKKEQLALLDSNIFRKYRKYMIYLFQKK